MLYAVIFALLLLLAYAIRVSEQLEQRHAEERRAWAQEREGLLNRIQYPHIAQAQAEQAAFGPSEPPLTEEQRIMRKAVEMGLSPDELKVPPGFFG